MHFVIASNTLQRTHSHSLSETRSLAHARYPGQVHFGHRPTHTGQPHYGSTSRTDLYLTHAELLLLTALAAVLRLLSVRVVYVAETNQRPSPSPFGPSVRPMHSQSYNGYV